AGNTAWIGMLYDDRGGFVELLQKFKRPVGVIYIIEGKFLAVELLRSGQAAPAGSDLPVEYRFLVRVFPVSHILHFFECERKSFGERYVSEPVPEIPCDECVIMAGVFEHLVCQPEFRFQRHITCRLDLFEYLWIIRRIHYDNHVLVILCSSSEHRWSAY